MRVIAAVASALLILEFTLAALAWTPATRVAVDRFSSLTRLPPSPAAVAVIGAVDLVGVVGVAWGFTRPMPAVLAGGWFALLSGWILCRQVAAGDRGSELLPYTLFTSAAVIVIVTRLVE